MPLNHHGDTGSMARAELLECDLLFMLASPCALSFRSCSAQIAFRRQEKMFVEMQKMPMAQWFLATFW